MVGRHNCMASVKCNTEQPSGIEDSPNMNWAPEQPLPAPDGRRIQCGASLNQFLCAIGQMNQMTAVSASSAALV